jgi:hypothetical protein
MRQEAYFPDMEIKRSENRVLRIVFNSDLRSAHDGLTKLAKSLKIPNPAELEIGTFLVFVNRKRNALKIFAAGNTVAHFKMPDGRIMNVKILGLIPRFFNGKELKYDEALKELITKEFGTVH